MVQTEAGNRRAPVRCNPPGEFRLPLRRLTARCDSRHDQEQRRDHTAFGEDFSD